ncbi:response regulator transcription factor [Pedobacter sp. 22163]|uniref:response regulator transcription factor n=1 Tax=Pedobacter sp. 22163 TaxID=3453883 RepID=UPI003F8650F7
MIKVAIADDQQLFLKSLSMLIDSLPGFSISLQALDGSLVISQLAQVAGLPDIVLLDVRMPVMNGPQTALEIKQRYPQIKLVALSMNDDDDSVIAMLKAGCCAYFLKDIHPDELERGLNEVYHFGYYNADSINRHLRDIISSGKAEHKLILNDREKTFLKLACSDMTYKQIASIMCLSEKTIDGYRESIFVKLNVKSRVGMALEAIRHNLVTI